MSADEAVLHARHALLDEIRKAARFAADFECSAGNFDRPIAETPWLADHRYGGGEYDARWYAVMGALTHFDEGLAGRVSDALDVYTAVLLTVGPPQQEGQAG